MGMIALACVSLTACSGEAVAPPEAIDSVLLTDDLCGQIPPAFVTTWSLSQTSSSIMEEDGTPVAVCTMTGTRNGRPVAFEVRVASHGGHSAQAASAAMQQDLAQRCADLERNPTGVYRKDADGCSSRTLARPTGRRGQMTGIHRATGAYGVVEVRMTHRGARWRSVASDAVGVSTTFTSRSRDDWLSLQPG